jgi:hypothetical protein
VVTILICIFTILICVVTILICRVTIMCETAVLSTGTTVSQWCEGESLRDWKTSSYRKKKKMFFNYMMCQSYLNDDIYSKKKKERMRIITLYKGYNRRNGKIEWRTWPMPIRKIAIWIQHETEFSWLRYKHFCLIISLLFHFFFFETKKACMWVCLGKQTEIVSGSCELRETVWDIVWGWAAGKG